MVMRGGFVKAPDSAGGAATPDPFAHDGNENRCNTRILNENSLISPYDPSAKLAKSNSILRAKEPPFISAARTTSSSGVSGVIVLGSAVMISETFCPDDCTYSAARRPG